MRPIDTIDFPNILVCVHDNAVLYILSEWKGQVMLSTLDPLTFRVISRFTLEIPVNHLVRSIVDDNSIYIPTMNGEIIGIDKFSGEKTVHCDLGMMTIVSNVEQDDQYVYTVCGLPIVHGLKTDTEIFCITSSNKWSGQKVGQSKIIRGKICPITVKHGHVWANIGKSMYKFSSACEEIERKELKFSPNYKTVVTNNFVCAASNKGSIEVFDKDTMRDHCRLLTGINSSPPFVVDENLVYWFVNNALYMIDLDSKSISKRHEFNTPVVSTPTIHKGDIYATDKAGNLIRVSGDTEIIPIEEVPFRQPVVFDDYILLISKEKIYRIEK